MKWEYHFILIDKLPRTMRGVFDAIGQDGWELVAIYDGVAWFKRPLESIELVTTSGEWSTVEAEGYFESDDNK